MERASLFERKLVVPALRDSFIKLGPRTLVRNPAMFTTAVVAAVALAVFLRNVAVGAGDPLFEGQLVFWLWLTVLFGNFAEALAEGRGKAQAQSLRSTKDQLIAFRMGQDGRIVEIPATQLHAGDVVRVIQGQLIPADGEVVAGVASVILRHRYRERPAPLKPAIAEAAKFAPTKTAIGPLDKRRVSGGKMWKAVI